MVLILCASFVLLMMNPEEREIQVFAFTSNDTAYIPLLLYAAQLS
jgi:hypothetical protein